MHAIGIKDARDGGFVVCTSESVGASSVAGLGRFLSGVLAFVVSRCTNGTWFWIVY